MKLIPLILATLVAGSLAAQEARVTSLISKELKESPGKEGLMILVEYPPGSQDPPSQRARVRLRAGGLDCDAGEGWQTGDTHSGANLLRRP
jgi:hypothetical protein